MRWAVAASLSPWLPPARAAARGLELRTLDLQRQDGALVLSFQVQLLLSRAVEDALSRGVPLYFEAQATLYRPRWYWLDARVARSVRTWRLAFQPLTSTWRVGLGGAMHQSVDTLTEALALMSRALSWKIADAEQVEVGDRCYVEFGYRLDTAQLPRPMQLDLATQSDWQLQVERTVKLD